jgi:phenylalanyl-tRNA synthetase beta chain
MRPSAFPNLLSSINPNVARLYTNGKLFEVGPNFNGLEEVDQQMVATGIQYGSSNSSSWLNEARVTDVFDVKSDVYYVLEQLNVPIESLIFKTLRNNVFHPGKSAQLILGKSIIANFGELNPLLLKRFDIKAVVCGFEIFIDKLEQFQIKKTSTKKAYDNNPYQVVERDFAFLFPKNIKAIDLINNIKKIDKQIIKKVIIFDVFEGKKLPENKKSIALKVILQPLEKTFTDSEIEKISTNIIDLISKSFGGELRH